MHQLKKDVAEHKLEMHKIQSLELDLTNLLPRRNMEIALAHNRIQNLLWTSKTFS